MDYHNWAPLFEIFRGLSCIVFLLLPQNQFIQTSIPWFFYFLLVYFTFTFFVGIWAKSKHPSRKLALT